MIHAYDRRFYIGGSDIDKYVMGNQNTKAWQKWWAIKCGLAEADTFINSAMRTGTSLEHSILKTWNPDIEWDGQIIYEPLMLRINYDGWLNGIVYEVKCHRTSTDWSWEKYRGQLIVQAWVYQKMAEELNLPEFKEIHVLEYAFTPDEECTIYDSETVEAGEIPLERDKIKDILIPYRHRQFKGIKTHLKPLAKKLKPLVGEGVV